MNDFFDRLLPLIRFTGKIHVRRRVGAPEKEVKAQLERNGRELGLLMETPEHKDPAGRWSMMDFKNRRDRFTADNESEKVETIWEAIEMILEDSNVDYAEPDAIFILPIGTEPTAERRMPTDRWWHLQAINAYEAWDLMKRKNAHLNSITVAHLDTGYTDHKAIKSLGSRLLRDQDRDFWSSDYDAHDPMTEGPGEQPGHGTSTMAILSCYHHKNPPDEYYGVNPWCKVLPIRVSPSVILIPTGSLARSINYATASGAAVITISMGGLPSQMWADAINHAYRSGVVICAAAGNNIPLGPFRTPSGVVYPAKFERVVAVSGITREEKAYWYPGRMSGNRGKEVDLCAPTPEIWAPIPLDGDDKYGLFGGTSSATPQVAGAAALWLAYYDREIKQLSMAPEEKVEACRMALLLGAEPVGPYSYEPVYGFKRTRNDYFGDGRLNIRNTLMIPPSDVAEIPAKPKANAWRSIFRSGFPFSEAAVPLDKPSAKDIRELWEEALM